MNTMADGARERCVAQIGEALFGQPGLTLMELAEKVKGMEEAGSDSRAQFEAWAKSANYNLSRFEASGDYQYATTSCAWQSWQASAARQQVASNQSSGNSGQLGVDGKAAAVKDSLTVGGGQVEGQEPVAWLIERLRGKGYGRDKYVVMKGQASSDPDSHLFWTDQQARDNHRITPLYAQTVDLGK